MLTQQYLRINRGQAPYKIMKQTVWVLFGQETVPFAEPAQPEEIYATEELAQKYCDKRTKKHYDYRLNQWRELNNKRPNEFPDKDLQPEYEFHIEEWPVNTE